MKKLSQAIVLASVVTAGAAVVPAVQAEVSASVDIASAYLFRGVNLSNGEAVVSGSIDYGHESGLYAGVWGSSGDAGLGTEYDVYVGFAGEAGDFGYDVGYVSYIYPNTADDVLNDFGEVYLGLSYAGASFGVAANTDSDKNGEYIYYTAGYGVDSVEATLGYMDDGDDDLENGYAHLDLSYAYNDNVSFTVSQIVSREDSDVEGDSTQFVVSYSLPIN